MNPLHQAGGRRIVTFVDDEGRSRIVPGEIGSRVSQYAATPGMRTAAIWAIPGLPEVGGAPHDPVPELSSIHPLPGGSMFLILTLPPDAIYGEPGFDFAAAAAEQAELARGIAERMESDAPGFHRTDTVDYVVVLAGEVWLVVDDDEVRLQPGDTVVQNGARHAWQNRSRELASLAVILLGAAKRP